MDAPEMFGIEALIDVVGGMGVATADALGIFVTKLVAFDVVGLISDALDVVRVVEAVATAVALDIFACEEAVFDAVEVLKAVAEVNADDVAVFGVMDDV